MIAANLPALVVVLPLLAALVCPLLGAPRRSWALAVVVTALSFAGSLAILFRVLDEGLVEALGAKVRGCGVEVADAGQHQPRGTAQRVRVGGDAGREPDAFERLGDAAQVAGAKIQYGDGGEGRHGSERPLDRWHPARARILLDGVAQRARQPAPWVLEHGGDYMFSERKGRPGLRRH